MLYLPDLQVWADIFFECLVRDFVIGLKEHLFKYRVHPLA